MGGAAQVYIEKLNVEVPVGLFFQGLNPPP